MGKKEQYERNLPLLLKDKKINSENKKLFKKFFEELEYKLKRKNGLKELTERQFKTLCGYIPYFRNVNKWFKNKDWKKITKKEIKQVYDDLEEQKLKSVNGKIILGKNDYYDKIFKSRPFELIGKDKIAREVMKYVSNKKQPVRFFTKETFDIIQISSKTLNQRLLCWLGWDYGENIFSLLQLKKKNFTRRINSETGEVEYVLNFPEEIIKSSRTSRSEINNFEETTKLLDLVLKDLNDEDYIFSFGHRQSLKFLKQIVRKKNLKCVNGEEITWKDFRSSMACNLLKMGWSTDEIKSRLGHSPSSRVLDKYVNYLAIGKDKSKEKVRVQEVGVLKEELNEIKLREKNKDREFEKMKNEMIYDKQQLQSHIRLIVNILDKMDSKELKKFSKLCRKDLPSLSNK